MVVVWRVTEHCNLRCRFCKYDRSLHWRRSEADPAVILRFGKLLSDYQQHTGERVLVSWLGGEPLLWHPLQSLDRVFRRELDLQLSTTTNGTPLASPQIRAHVSEHYRELTISVDGLASFHNVVRRFKNGFEQLRRDVMYLCPGQPILKANIVLMRGNIRDMEMLCRDLATWGIQEITFNQLGGKDRPEFYPENRLLPEQAEWLAAQFPHLREVCSQLGILLHGGPAYLHRILATSLDQPLPVADCCPGRRFLFIDTDGVVAPCSFTAGSYGYKIAEITNVQALLRLPILFNARRSAQPKEDSCGDCHSTQVFDKFAV